MIKQDGKIKNYLKLANPKKGIFTLQFLTAVLFVTGKLVEPIFEAQVITGLVDGDYRKAYLNLMFTVVIVLARNTAFHFNYILYNKNFTFMYHNIQGKIYNKIMSAKAANFLTTSKEKLLNIIGTDIEVICDFTDQISYRFAKMVQIIQTMIFCFVANIYVGLAVLCLGLIDFFILRFLNVRIASLKNKRLESKDKIFEQFSQLVDGQEIINEFNAKEMYHKKYREHCQDYISVFNKNTLWFSYKANAFYAFYKILILAITCLLIFLVSSGTLTLTLYLIMVPYLLSCTELLNDLINITSVIEECNVSTKRINTILNFTDSEIIKFGNIKANDEAGNIIISDVCYTNTDDKSDYKGVLHKINFAPKDKGITVINGGKGCGKRLLFNTLRRRIKPDSGIVLINDINLYDYDVKEYSKVLSYVSSKPSFLNDSILNNLRVVERDRNAIFKICRDIGIHDFIMSLPDKYNTSINSQLIPKDKYFLIGLCRALLTKSSIIMIYESPVAISDDEKEKIRHILLELKGKKTIIIFVYTKEFNDLADLVYDMDKGKIKQIK